MSIPRELRLDYYFKLEKFTHPEIFVGLESVLEIKPRLIKWMDENVKRRIEGDVHPSAHIEGNVTVESGATVGAFALIEGPAYISKGTDVRHGAYVREHVFVGPNSKIGHSTEVCRSLLLSEVRATHFAFIGDSIIGNNVNIGSSSVLANLRADRAVTEPATDEIFVRIGPDKIGTGMTKFGAVIGDNSRTAALMSLAPGTLIGPDSIIFPRNQSGGTFPPFTRIVS